MVKWRIFRNFMVEIQLVMNEISPLNQDLSAGAISAGHATKLQKDSKTRRSIWNELKDFAYSIPDFRRLSKGNVRHRLGDIIILQIMARMSCCVSRADIMAYGEQHLRQFQSEGLLSHGVPSEPTLCRVDNGIEAAGFADRVAQFTQALYEELMESFSLLKMMCEIICIDGKAMRGTVQQNGRSPDIVSAYSPFAKVTLATEACQEKSNEIKAIPLLIDKLDIAGKLITADAMAMQKDIIDKIRAKGGHFLIELKANQRALRYGVEDKIKEVAPMYTYSEGPELGHGRIETRTYNVYDGLQLIADKDKWGGNLTVVEFVSRTRKKSTGEEKTETRLYVTSLPVDTPWLGKAIRLHWLIESMHWNLDVNLQQDKIKRKSATAARNLDTIQRLALALFSVWKGRRKKRSDKSKGLKDLMRTVSQSFTKLKRFLSQK